MGQKKIKIAIAGVGNCASSLVQGIEFYRTGNQADREEHIGLMHYDLGGYKPEDIEVVAAFDIDKRKVNKPLHEAIFAKPNSTMVFTKEISRHNVNVHMGNLLDGVSDHMKDHPADRTFVVANEHPSNVEKILKDSGAEMLMCYLPVGSEDAARYYAKVCLNTGISLINCIPVFIVSDKEWSEQFLKKGIPCIGDDIKAQIGATIVHRTLTKLFVDRGVRLDRTYQLNTGGNTDFLNMMNQERLASKKISKTEAVQSQLEHPLDEENIHIGPSDYVPWQNDNKVCFLRMEGRGFGGVPMNIELRLSVEDSPNSAGVAIDAIRICKIARERGIAGSLTSISAYTMKHPAIQIPDFECRQMVDDFISGKRER